jgi:hypothetical protein
VPPIPPTSPRNMQVTFLSGLRLCDGHVIEARFTGNATNDFLYKSPESNGLSGAAYIALM